MAPYTALVRWARGGAVYSDNKYSRAHTWRFDGGIDVRASSSPSVVPLPMSAHDAVDPEEAFVAALSSCHMLTFLHLACRAGFVVDSYEDTASGVMAPIESGRFAVSEVTLRPRVTFADGRAPSDAEHDALHHRAHKECFIANSVKTEVRCEPEMA